MRSRPAHVDPWVVIALACLAVALAGATAVLAPTAGSPIVAVLAVTAIAAPSLVALGRWLGPGAATRLLAALALFAYAMEAIGVRTGWPYGRFAYGDGLGPSLFDTMPALLPLAYVPLVLGAMAVATRWARGFATGGWVTLGVVTLLGCDLVLDPGAVAMGYWRYEGGGPYYGVPIVNYAGWAVSGTLALLIAARGARRAECLPGAWLSSSMAMLVAFYAGVCAASGLTVPAVVGVGIAGLGVAAAAPRRGGAGHRVDG